MWLLPNPDPKQHPGQNTLASAFGGLLYASQARVLASGAPTGTHGQVFLDLAQRHQGAIQERFKQLNRLLLQPLDLLQGGPEVALRLEAQQQCDAYKRILEA